MGNEHRCTQQNREQIHDPLGSEEFRERRDARSKGILVPDGDAGSEDCGTRYKVEAILESASLNEFETADGRVSALAFFATDKPIDRCTQHTANDRGHPEKPQL